jgi:hypothetical protein
VWGMAWEYGLCEKGCSGREDHALITSLVQQGEQGGVSLQGRQIVQPELVIQLPAHISGGT